MSHEQNYEAWIQEVQIMHESEEQFSRNILLHNGNEYLFTQFPYNEKIDNFATHRGVFRGIGYFWFVARYQIPVRCNVLNQLKQSGAWVRACSDIDYVVGHAQF